MNTKTTFKAISKANHTFVTKDSTAQQFELYINEKGEDGEIFISGHVQGVTLAAQVRKLEEGNLLISFFLLDIATSNYMESSTELPVDAEISNVKLAEELFAIAGHALSTAGWYQPACRIKELWSTICLHIDAVMPTYGLDLDMFRRYKNTEI